MDLFLQILVLFCLLLWRDFFRINHRCLLHGSLYFSHRYFRYLYQSDACGIWLFIRSISVPGRLVICGCDLTAPG